jgi:hypothetical protein
MEDKITRRQLIKLFGSFIYVSIPPTWDTDRGTGQ